MKEIKYEDSKDILFTEYASELLECFRNELLNYDKWEMMGAFIQLPHQYVANEVNKVKADILSDEGEMKKYTNKRERLQTLLLESKTQIKEMLETKKILAFLDKE